MRDKKKMEEKLKKAFIEKVSEILDKPLSDAKIQIEYHRHQVPLVRYDVTEYILPSDTQTESE